MNCRIESQFVNLKKKKKFKGEIREIIKDRCEYLIGIHSFGGQLGKCSLVPQFLLLVSIED